MDSTPQDDLERRARAAFDAEPHRHPSGRTPDWDFQPQHIRDVFRSRVVASDKAEARKC